MFSEAYPLRVLSGQFESILGVLFIVIVGFNWSRGHRPAILFEDVKDCARFHLRNVEWSACGGGFLRRKEEAWIVQ